MSMTEQVLHVDGVEIRMERDYDEVRTLGGPAPDPDWSFTDAKGHQHRYVEDEWPTLKWVVDRTYWCEDCRDEHQEGHWECAQCGEHIKPGMVKRPPEVKLIPLPARYFVNGREVSEDEARAVAADLESRG